MGRSEFSLTLAMVVLTSCVDMLSIHNSLDRMVFPISRRSRSHRSTVRV